MTMKKNTLFFLLFGLTLTGCHIDVEPPVVTGTLTIDSDGSFKRAAIGDDIQLVAKLNNKVTTTVNWSVENDEGSGTITSNGLFIGTSAGNVKVIATHKNNVEIVTFTQITVVTEIIVPTALSLSFPQLDYLYLNVSESTTVLATFAPANAYSDILWSTSDNRIATISNEGVIHAVAAGKVNIVAYPKSDPSLLKNVILSIVEVESGLFVSLNENPLELAKGADDILEVTMSKGITMSDLSFSSSNPFRAPITSAGVYSPLHNGEVTFTVYYKLNPNISSSRTFLIRDAIVNPTSFSLFTDYSSEIIINDTLQLSTSGLPQNATFTASFSSSNDLVATVSEFGKVSAIAEGIVTITATSTLVSSLSSSLEITVTNPSGIEKTPSSPYNMETIDSPNYAVLPSSGKPRIAVVPVQLVDGPVWSETMLDVLYRGFFGETYETGFESVYSYYYKSSYGKLEICGDVLPIYYADYTINEGQAMSDFSNLSQVTSVSDGFYYSTDSEILRKYDMRGDGFMDAVYFVYSNKTNPSNRNPAYWGWKYWANIHSSIKGANVQKPIVSNYMWASYDFFEEQYPSNLPDSHTLIHESGHILGLDDYYDYDYTTSPLGGIDMMDHNLGDQNPYSKYLLGWVEPYYVSGSNSSVTVNLNSFTETGSFVLINNQWNQHQFDEYLIVDFYTPTGLNYADSIKKLADSVGGRPSTLGFTNSGIRIHHVDSRLWGNPIVPGAGNDVSLSNTTSRNGNSNKLIRFIQSSGVPTFLYNTTTAKNADLFGVGSTFDSSNSAYFPTGKFNKGVEIGCSIYVSAINGSTATLVITFQ